MVSSKGHEFVVFVNGVGGRVWEVRLKWVETVTVRWWKIRPSSQVLELVCSIGLEARLIVTVYVFDRYFR